MTTALVALRRAPPMRRPIHAFFFGSGEFAGVLLPGSQEGAFRVIVEPGGGQNLFRPLKNGPGVLQRPAEIECSLWH